MARRRADSRVTSRPKSSMLPSVSGSSPEMTLNSVVLPAPLGPRMARRSPGLTSRSTSATARRPPKRWPTPRRRRTGSALCAYCGATAKSRLCSAEVDRHRVPNPGRWRLRGAHGVGPVRSRRGRAEETTERLVDVRDALNRLDPGHVAPRWRRSDLHDPVVEDRLVPAVEADLAVRPVDHLLGQRTLK